MKKEIFTSEILVNARRLVVGYVLNNSGTIEDANDILQEGFEVFILNLRKPDFKLKTKPESYIFCVCRNLWLNHLNSEKRNIDHCREFEDISAIGDDQIILKQRKEFLLDIIDKNMKRLTQKCQEIFKLRKEGLSYEEIANRMNFKKGSISKDKYYRCKKRLLELISKDQEYLNFMRFENEINEKRS
ncbi:MAG: sigma-70 family RNA polymerase sigma factor [Bacteroidales bacterium]|nr:sigma-70 family RNA polymerase sigma factor [Bacteroidales bacterium]MDT8431227.1 sigma-70 family RNA polymerase sigma factor [Bacteroidales bacterium]